jgi:hypothetical protein
MQLSEQHILMQISEQNIILSSGSAVSNKAKQLWWIAPQRHKHETDGIKKIRKKVLIKREGKNSINILEKSNIVLPLNSSSKKVLPLNR